MNRNYALVSPLATVQEAVEAMERSGAQVAIVDRADEDDAYGILTYQEIVYRVIARALPPTRTRVAEVMVKPLIVVNPTLRLPLVAQLLARVGIQNAPVIDEHQLAGVVSSADLVRALVMRPEE
jgi:CBS domain-containing protein